MTKLACFDVLIVYTELLAHSASDKSKDNSAPFPLNASSQSYNNVYGYFLEICEKFKLNAAFSTSADIVGPGFCHSFWTFKNKKWIKNNYPCYSDLIFDKFSPIRSRIKSRRQLLFSSIDIKPFNEPGIFDLFFDKQKTYNRFSDHTIPTISINGNTFECINNACKTLTKLVVGHPGSNDFSSDFIMKDRFGAGGRRVYKFKTDQLPNMLSIVRKNTRVSYIIQPFAKFDQGFSYKNCYAPADIRFIYLQGKIIQIYIRAAKSGDFRCNEHQGGSLTYISTKDIPTSLLEKSNSIAKVLSTNCSLFSLDFIISNSGNSYLLEGNTGPGLDWNTSIRKNEIKSKKLIRLIVKDLLTRIKPKMFYPSQFHSQTVYSTLN